MADKHILAQQVYGKLVSALQAREWNFDRDDSNFKVRFTVHGDDLPMDMVMTVDEDRQLIRLLSLVPVTMDEDKRMEGAIATTVATFGLPDGSFDYDITDGTIGFRQNVAFHDSDISENLIQYMISWACAVIDKYNDQFLAINKGYLSIQDFISSES